MLQNSHYINNNNNNNINNSKNNNMKNNNSILSNNNTILDNDLEELSEMSQPLTPISPHQFSLSSPTPFSGKEDALSPDNSIVKDISNIMKSKNNLCERLVDYIVS